MNCVLRAHAFVLTASLLGVAAPAWAFRTAADDPAFAGTAKVRWASGSLPFEIHTDVPSNLSFGDVESIVVQAFETWTRPSCTLFSIDYRGATTVDAAPGDGRNTIQWIHFGWADRGFPSPGAGSVDAAAVTDVQYEKQADGTWAIVEADIYLNADSEQWTLRGDGGQGHSDVLSVITHEAGHMLGLYHPCEPAGAGGAPDCALSTSFSKAVMYPFYDPTHVALADDDANGVCFLYPTLDCTKLGCPSGESCTSKGCGVDCKGTTCAPGQVCQQGTCAAPDAAAVCSPGLCPSTPCSSDSQCPKDLKCVSGRCTRGDAPAGDPCTSTSDCQQGGCSTDGYCTATCTSNADCGDGAQCKASSPVSTCVGTKQPFGDKCHQADDCISAQCLSGVLEDPVCTRSCGGTEPACPYGWVCNSASGQNVCMPDTIVGGCACRSTHRTNQSGWATLPPLIALWLFRRRPAIRRRHTKFDPQG